MREVYERKKEEWKMDEFIKKTRQSLLSDCYSVTGKDYISFQNEVMNQEMYTQFLTNVKLGNINVCYYHKERTKRAKVEADGKKYIYFTYLQPGKVWNENYLTSEKNNCYTITTDAKIAEEKWKLIPKEVRGQIEETGYFLYIKGAGYYREIKDSYNVALRVEDMEDETISINERTIFLVYNNIGNEVWKKIMPNMENCIEKYLFLVKNLERYAEQKIGIVYRMEKGIKKIVAFTGPKYPYAQFPLTSIISLTDKLKQEMKMLGYGEPTYSWEVQQAKCVIRLYFRQYGKQLQKKYKLPDEFIPCIEITNSDTCQSALSSRKLIWYKKEDSYVELKNLEYSKDHKAVKRKKEDNPETQSTENSYLDEYEVDEIINLSDFVKEDLKRIEQYERFYKRLQQGLYVMVTAPDNELEKSAEIKDNKKAYETLLRTTMQNTGVSKILGMKRKKEILDIFRENFNEQRVFTEYDILKDLMKIPRMADLNEPHARELRVCAGSF